MRAGKILYVGISDAPVPGDRPRQHLAELRGWTPFIGNQLEYNLTERPERDLPMSKELGP